MNKTSQPLFPSKKKTFQMTNTRKSYQQKLEIIKQRNKVYDISFKIENSNHFITICNKNPNIGNKSQLVTSSSMFWFNLVMESDSHRIS